MSFFSFLSVWQTSERQRSLKYKSTYSPSDAILKLLTVPWFLLEKTSVLYQKKACQTLFFSHLFTFIAIGPIDSG